MESIAARYDDRLPSESDSRAREADCCCSSVSTLTALVDLLVQQLYLELRLHVDAVVLLRGLAIDVLLSVLAHHDDRRRAGGLERKREIEKNERVGVPA